MTMLTRTLLLGLAVMAVLGTGCADQQASRPEPKAEAQNACTVAHHRSRCRLNHDLAGGYPATGGGGR